jgi:DNA-binding transcriptional regulator YiaG
MIKSEIVRLAKREVRSISLPLGKDVRLLKSTVSQLRKTVQSLQRFAARQEAESRKEKVVLESPPEEIQASRFSPRLIRSLRKRLGITQKELAQLMEVTVGAIHQWEGGKFEPREQKKGMMVALRKMGRREVRELLEKKGNEKGETKPSPRRRAKGAKGARRTKKR